MLGEAPAKCLAGWEGEEKRLLYIEREAPAHFKTESQRKKIVGREAVFEKIMAEIFFRMKPTSPQVENVEYNT